MDSYNLTHTGAELDSAVGRALEGFAAADAATKAANDAAKLAEDTAAEVQKKLDNGEFVGPIGKSGVYVGSGDMPEGYTVQVDPTGDMLCYTAGESDSRYLRATEIRRPFADGVITLADADDAAFGGVTVLGATTEAGTGDKGPDNPYTLTGVQPASLTVCGRNLLPSNATSGTTAGLTRTVDENGVIHLSGTASSKVVVAVLSRRETPYFWLREKAYRPVEETKLMIILVAKEDGTTAWTNSRDISTHVPCGILSASYEFAAGTPDVNTLYPYLGLEPNRPYTPYTGQTVPLPALEPLYGTGDIRDEYDAATGVETRRWKRVTLDGTEAWAVSATGTAGKYRVSLSIEDILPTATFSQVSSCRCSHYATISADNTYHLQVGISANYGTSHGIFIYDDAYDVQDVTGWKTYLAAQYAAGTPVTVVYQLAEPVVTRYGPQRIPTYPGCTNLMLDISAEGAVQYPISAAMQWDAKADKTVSDDRYANVLTGAASGPVAALEDVSPTGALRRAAVLGATTETGEGDKSPDNPYTLAGVQPAKVTVCGRNLLKNGKSTTTINGIAFTVNQDDSITIQGTATEKAVLYLMGAVLQSGTAYTLSGGAIGWTGASLEVEITYANGAIEYRAVSTKPAYAFVTRPDAITRVRAYIKVDAGATVNGITLYPQLEFGTAATPYTPYTGQAVPLPALAPLYGDGTVNDEYDAVTGVETRRWGRVELDGTEAWITRTSGTGVYGYALPDVFDAPAAAGVCTHFSFVKNGASGTQTAVCVASASTRKDLSVFTTIATLDDFKAWLSARATAGTPVTVLYQLAEPVITQHDPARILPPTPVCRIFADAGNTAVGYNRDVNIVIPKLEAALAELLGGGAQPMT